MAADHATSPAHNRLDGAEIPALTAEYFRPPVPCRPSHEPIESDAMESALVRVGVRY